MQEDGKVSSVAIAGLQSMETLKASGLESDFFTCWAGQLRNITFGYNLTPFLSFGTNIRSFQAQDLR
ncbi:MAG: hypothetical protein PUP92_36985 [Rhizonema sp. PD38]|nr:hypothetical protein [Rhizonema sp. PD38]